MTPTRTDRAFNQRLAAVIAAYWRARGYKVDVRVEKVYARVCQDPDPRCQVRSALVNGLPR